MIHLVIAPTCIRIPKLQHYPLESKDENARKLLKSVEDLHTYVERNREFVPNYGERYRNGEKIASGFVESAINQVVSKRMLKKNRWDGVNGEHLSSSRFEPGARRGMGEHLPALVSGFPPSMASQESGLIPRNLPVSYLIIPTFIRSNVSATLTMITNPRMLC